MKLLHNAHFYINGVFSNHVRGLLIEDGKILKLCRSDELSIPKAEKIDLEGAFVYPGFIDAHTHSFSGGLYTDGIDLSCCPSISDLLSLLNAADNEHKEFIIAWRFDESTIREQRFPTLKELDAACPNSKLLLRRVDGHSCIINSAARKVIPGLQCNDEVLTGFANDLAVNWLQDNCDEQTILKAYHAAARVALKGGFTRIHTMIGDAQQDNQHYRFLSEKLSDFSIGFVLYPQSFNLKSALELGAKRIGGCILADGSIGSHTAAMSHPYYDRSTKGTLYQDDTFWSEFITQAHKNNLQVCIHCIGDAAIRQINNVYLKLDPDSVRSLRHQLIHCEVTPDDLLEEISASGAVPVMQPVFDLLWGGNDALYADRLGLDRSKVMNRLGSFTRSGVRICGSSDWYVTDLNIAMSLHSAINHHNPQERLTPQQAIQIYTENNAWLDHEETLRGKIETHYIADLSIMDTDFTKPFDYHKSTTLCIIRDKEIVYGG